MRGTQQSIVIMVVVGVIAVSIGTVIGAVSGFFRGWRDSVLMRFTDIIITIPVIVVGAVVGKAVGNQGALALAIVLGLFAWTGLARLVRAEVLSLRGGRAKPFYCRGPEGMIVEFVEYPFGS